MNESEKNSEEGTNASFNNPEKKLIKRTSSIAGYIKWVNSLQANADAEAKAYGYAKNCYAFLYRGHSDKELYKLEPSVYREIECEDENKNKYTGSFRDVESSLYQETLRLNPQAFKDDTTTFERLVRMQHYGLPTRILDLTENPLVALFFACNEEKTKEKDGEVICFRIKKAEVLFPTNIPDTHLLGIESNLPMNFLSEIFLKMFGEFREIVARNQPYIEAPDELNRILNNIEDKTSIRKIIDEIVDKEKAIRILFSNSLRNLELKSCSGDTLEESVENLYKIYDQLKSLISEYCTKFKIENYNFDYLTKFISYFTHFSFIYPPYNNERILRQKGAFLMFPITPTSDGSNLNKALEELNYKEVRITIDKSAKKQILKELSLLGIDRSFLFPQLDQVVKDVMAKYPAKEITTTK